MARIAKVLTGSFLGLMAAGAVLSTAHADPPAPGDHCAPQIANNAAAAGVCGPVCERAGMRFAGNWSNDRTHPPVAQCIARHQGQAVCGCAARPGDRCAPQIANNAAAASVCGPVCERAGMRFAGNWSNDRSHPPVAQCVSRHEGEAVCGCAAP
jgi:hypothetical protein